MRDLRDGPELTLILDTDSGAAMMRALGRRPAWTTYEQTEFRIAALPLPDPIQEVEEDPKIKKARERSEQVVRRKARRQQPKWKRR